MALLWLPLFLASAQGPNPPIKNLRMDPESRRLTWEVGANVSGVACETSPGGHYQTATENKYCSYEELLPRCEVTNYTVSVEQPPFSASILFPEPAGDPAAGASGLRCRVQDAVFLTCTWAVGGAAPADVQFRAFRRDPRSESFRECGHYVTSPGGVNTGCRFRGVSRDPGVAIVLVNGTGRGAAVPCAEFAAPLGDIEDLATPNLTATCNASLSAMRWAAPASAFGGDFEYELRIRRNPGTHELIEKVRTCSFQLPNPGSSFTVRIKAKSLSRDAQSAWSVAQRFGCGPAARGWWAPATAAAAAALAAALATLLLCRRFSPLRRVCPPIPRVRDPAPGQARAGPLVPWEAEDCAVAEVQELEPGGSGRAAPSC